MDAGARTLVLGPESPRHLHLAAPLCLSRLQEIRKLARDVWRRASERGEAVCLPALVDLLGRSDPDLSTLPNDDGDILQVRRAAPHDGRREGVVAVACACPH